MIKTEAEREQLREGLKRLILAEDNQVCDHFSQMQYDFIKRNAMQFHDVLQCYEEVDQVYLNVRTLYGAQLLDPQPCPSNSKAVQEYTTAFRLLVSSQEFREDPGILCFEKIEETLYRGIVDDLTDHIKDPYMYAVIKHRARLLFPHIRYEDIYLNGCGKIPRIQKSVVDEVFQDVQAVIDTHPVYISTWPLGIDDIVAEYTNLVFHREHPDLKDVRITTDLLSDIYYAHTAPKLILEGQRFMKRQLDAGIYCIFPDNSIVTVIDDQFENGEALLKRIADEGIIYAGTPLVKDCTDWLKQGIEEKERRSITIHKLEIALGHMEANIAEPSQTQLLRLQVERLKKQRFHKKEKRLDERI